MSTRSPGAARGRGGPRGPPRAFLSQSKLCQTEKGCPRGELPFVKNPLLGSIQRTSEGFREFREFRGVGGKETGLIQGPGPIPT